MPAKALNELEISLGASETKAVEWRRHLPAGVALNGVSPVAVSPTTSPALVVSGEVAAGTQCSFKVSGGVIGYYELKVTVSLDSGDTVVGVCPLKVI